MLVPTFWVALCLASSVTMAASSLDKPYYDLKDADNLFKDYLKQYGKTYDKTEYSERLEIFKESLKDINSRNERYPLTVFKVNHFSDLTSEELELYRGIVPVDEAPSEPSSNLSHLPEPKIPEFDWRKMGVISHVKDQGPCGAGYLFSIIGQLEANYAMKYKRCISLSESQILDCRPSHRGCNGGELRRVHSDLLCYGLMMEKDYPYYPGKQKCRKNDTKIAAEFRMARYGKDEEKYFKYIILNEGPTAACLSAADFKHYAGGILEPHLCTNATIDHCVLIVGFGEENGEKFWILKNSYGVLWGENGYLRLRRGVQACGLGNGQTYCANSIPGYMYARIPWDF